MTTFEQVKKDPVGKVYIDRIEDGVRFMVLRGPGSLCAYVSDCGPDAKLNEIENILDNKEKEIDLRCHGGITYQGRGGYLPPGYWYGWDYVHAGDRLAFHGIDEEKRGIGWTPEMVDEDSKETIKEFRKLMKD